MTEPHFYVDASIIAGLILGDLDVGALSLAIQPRSVLSFTDFGFGEVVSALAARARAVGETDDYAAAMISNTRHFLLHWPCRSISPVDMKRATYLTGRPSIPLKFSDAIHIAVAERLKMPLLTADVQQHRAAGAIGLSSTLLLANKVT